MNWLAGFKKLTHAIALAGAAGLAWAFSPQDRCVYCRFGADPRRPKCLYLKDLPEFVLQLCSCRE